MVTINPYPQTVLPFVESSKQRRLRDRTSIWCGAHEERERQKRNKTKATKLYSLAGLLCSEVALIHTHPFRSTHHTISTVALVGGGTALRPGEVSLAHHGVLLADLAGSDGIEASHVAEVIQYRSLDRKFWGE